jgi:hypothetical protein
MGESDFTFDERNLRHQVLDGRVRFYRNPRDPGAYDLVIDGRISFYIPDRSLEELARGSTDHMIESLAEANKNHSLGLSYTLQRNVIYPQTVHVGICQLYIKEEDALRGVELSSKS